jgi:RNA polymerase sigma-70 factor (ECF subfamily)
VIGRDIAASSAGWSEVDDDRELVEAAQEEPSEFAAIYTRYAQRVYLYVRSRVATEDDAVDITQQVFVKSFKALPSYRVSHAPLCAWLFRIARNAIVDHHRKARPTTDLDAIPTILREPGIGPEDWAVRSEDVDRLRRALQALDPAKRDLLALRYAGNLRIREIAVATGRSEEATKKQLSRALKTLRQQYDAIS